MECIRTARRREGEGRHIILTEYSTLVYNIVYRLDDQGHFLMCLTLNHVCGPVLEILFVSFRNPSIEKLVFQDIEGEDDTVFAVAWSLAILTEYIWECNYKNTTPDLKKLIGIMRYKLYIEQSSAIVQKIL